MIGWWLAAAFYLVGVGAMLRFFGIEALKRLLIWGIVLGWPLTLPLFLVHDVYWMLRENRTIKRRP